MARILEFKNETMDDVTYEMVKERRNKANSSLTVPEFYSLMNSTIQTIDMDSIMAAYNDAVESRICY